MKACYNSSDRYDIIRNTDRRAQGGIYINNTVAWNYAIGMIKVDGLEPTADFKKYIEKEKRGEATMEDVKQFLDKKYKMKEPVNA